MNCRKAQRRLSEWIDSGCPDDAVKDHVAACSTCEQVAEQLQQIVQAAQQLPPCDAPPELLGRVLAADDERRRDANSRRGYGLLAGALAAAAAVTVAVMILLPRQQTPARRVEQATASPVVTPPPAAKQDPSAALLAAAQAEFQRAELHYQRAISRLREIASKDSGNWKERRRRSYLQELMIIEQVVARCKSAAQMASDDPTAQEMLYGAYRRQIRHMQDAILASHEAVR